MIDLDALGKAEGENWVWSGADCLRPTYQRCLISLSRGGADATVVREFDLPSKTFVKDGFFVPEAKNCGELDRRRHALRRHRLRPGLDDRLRLSAHGAGLEARRRARGRADRVRGQARRCRRVRRTATTPRASSATSTPATSPSTPTSCRCCATASLSASTSRTARSPRSTANGCTCSCARTGASAARPTSQARCSPPSSMRSWPASARSRCCSSRPSGPRSPATRRRSRA